MTAPDDRKEPSFEDAAMQHQTSTEHAQQVDLGGMQHSEFHNNENARIGETLRGARERKGWSIDEVSQLLKVRPYMIKSLESGEIDSKGWIYIQGFYKSYSDLLGVDRNTLPELQQPLGMRGVERYSALAGKPVFCQELSDENIPRPTEPPVRFYKVLAVIAFLLVVVSSYFAVAASGINFSSISNLQKSVTAKIWSTKIINTIPPVLRQPLENSSSLMNTQEAPVVNEENQ